MIIQLHTPGGILEIDSDIFTDAELASLGSNRAEFYEQFNLVERARANDLLSMSPSVITQPEIWELLRIFGKMLGL